jgi:hypothetical protein
VSYKDSSHSPTVVILHGGPHSVSVSSYVKSSAFLASLGFNLLIVNYRYVPWNFSSALQLCMSTCHHLTVIWKKKEVHQVLGRRLYNRFLEK